MEPDWSMLFCFAVSDQTGSYFDIDFFEFSFFVGSLKEQSQYGLRSQHV